MNEVLTYRGQVVFHKISMPAPKRMMKPFHSKEACFMYINAGEFNVRGPQELIRFDKSKALLTKCFDFYFETDPTIINTEPLEAIGVYLHSEIIEELFEIDLSKSSYKVDYNLKAVQIDKLFESFKMSIEVLLDNPELADEAMIGTKLKEFILLLVKSQDAPAQDFLASLFKLNAYDFRKTVSHNLYSNMTVDEFANLCGMSISSFKRRFSEVYGTSPNKYFSEKKLEKARELLGNTSSRISEIAYDCGYETISTFNRTFKMKYGVSPTEFRMSQSA